MTQPSLFFPENEINNFFDELTGDYDLLYRLIAGTYSLGYVVTFIANALQYFYLIFLIIVFFNYVYRSSERPIESKSPLCDTELGLNQMASGKIIR